MPRKIIAPQRREQIIQALFDCLAEKGHEKITVKDIARRADLHYGVIHYYFDSKDEIVSAMADFIISKYESLLLERLRPAESSSEKLRMAIDFLVSEFIFNRRLNRVFYNLVQMAFERKEVREALRRQLQAYRDHIADVVKEGIESGEFPRCDTSKAASLMVALIEGMALQWVINPKVLDRPAIHDLIETIVAGYLSDPDG